MVAETPFRAARWAGAVRRGWRGSNLRHPITQVYTYPGGSFEVSLPSAQILIGNGKSVALDAVITPLSDPAPVPEPASLAVIGVSALLLGMAFRRRVL